MEDVEEVKVGEGKGEVTSVWSEVGSHDGTTETGVRRRGGKRGGQCESKDLEEPNQ